MRVRSPLPGGRFAAKEATVKALGGADGALPWDSIGVERDADGRPCLRLSGAAARAARAAAAPVVSNLA